MNSLLPVIFLGVTITLSQARYSDKNLKQEETNLLFNKAETLQNTIKLIGETKVKAQFYAVETDTKWANMKHDEQGLLMKLLHSKNGQSIKEIRINKDKSTSTSSTSSTTFTLDLDNINEVASEPKRKSDDKFDYLSSQVAIYSWPVKKNDIPTCAGSLISNRYVLTTANCVDKYVFYNNYSSVFQSLNKTPKSKKRVLLVFGARNIQESEPFQVKVESSYFIINKKWNSNTLQNNIALIKLPKPIKVNEYISPVTLPSKSDENKTFTDYNATLVGWSSDYEEGIAMPINATDVIISNEKCFSAYKSLIVSSHICLSGSSRSNSSCVGENGDQLIVEDDRTAKLIGLLSFGMIHGCEWKQPVVFTRVTSHLPWILSHAEMK